MGNGVYSIEYFHDGGPFMSNMSMKAERISNGRYVIEITTNDVTDWNRIQDWIVETFDRNKTSKRTGIIRR